MLYDYIFLFSGYSSSLYLTSWEIPEKLCYQNMYQTKDSTGQAAECLRNGTQFHIHPWCIDLQKFHKNLSFTEVAQKYFLSTDDPGAFFKKYTLEYAHSTLKHVCTLHPYSIFSLEFQMSQFSIFAVMKIPRDASKRSLSLKLKIPIPDDINWVDAIVEYGQFTKCPQINILKPKYSLHFIAMERTQKNNFLEQESKNIANIIFNVKFVHNSTKEEQLRIITQSSYSFHNLYTSNVNTKLKFVYESLIKFSHYKSHHLFFFYGNINSISIQSINNNSDSILEILPIEPCNHNSSIYQYVYTKFLCHKDNCDYYCFNYSTLKKKPHEQLDTYYVFIYHPDISIHFCEKKILARPGRRGQICGPTKGPFGECLKGSWKEAYEVCAKLGGTLPVIRSRDELDELISLLYLPNLPPPMMTIVFIGLVEIHVCYNLFKQL